MRVMLAENPKSGGCDAMTDVELGIPQYRWMTYRPYSSI
jgi:hypothetical protein